MTEVQRKGNSLMKEEDDKSVGEEFVHCFFFAHGNHKTSRNNNLRSVFVCQKRRKRWCLLKFSYQTNNMKPSLKVVVESFFPVTNVDDLRDIEASLH